MGRKTGVAGRSRPAGAPMGEVPVPDVPGSTPPIQSGKAAGDAQDPGAGAGQGAPVPRGGQGSGTTPESILRILFSVFCPQKPNGVDKS